MFRNKIIITIPGLPPMANGSHGNPFAKNRERQKWQRTAILLLKSHAPKKPYDRIKVIFTRFSSNEPDYDGLVHGFKPIVDAFKKTGFIKDDKMRHLESIYLYDKAPPKKGYIQLEIELPEHQSDMTL